MSLRGFHDTVIRSAAVLIACRSPQKLRNCYFCSRYFLVPTRSAPNAVSVELSSSISSDRLLFRPNQHPNLVSIELPRLHKLCFYSNHLSSKPIRRPTLKVDTNQTLPAYLAMIKVQGNILL